MSSPPPTPPCHEPSEAEIQNEAYFLWLASDRAPGRDLENWDAARERLRHRVHLAPDARGPHHPAPGGRPTAL